MSVQRRGDKFTARVYVRGDWQWLGTFDTEPEAWDAFNEAKRARVKRQETIAQFADRWLREFNHATKGGVPRWSDSTLDHYRGCLKPFIKNFGTTRLGDFDVTDARQWALKHPEGYSRAIAAMFADARRDGLIVANPFEKLRLSRSKGRSNIVAITESELEKLCEIAGSRWGDTFEAMVATLGYVGIRPGELFALAPGDIDLKAGELHVRHAFPKKGEIKGPKNDKARRVILPSPAAERIARLPRPLHGWLFQNGRGRRFRESTLLYRWEPVRTAWEAQLPPLRLAELTAARPRRFDPYELRHAAATFLLRRGATPEDVAYQLGHTDGGKLVRELYGHPEDEWRMARLRAAYESNVTDLKVAEEASDG